MVSSISFLADNKLTIKSTFLKKEAILYRTCRGLLVVINNPDNELLKYLLYN
jgi:hypothetical protein